VVVEGLPGQKEISHYSCTMGQQWVDPIYLQEAPVTLKQSQSYYYCPLSLLALSHHQQWKDLPYRKNYLHVPSLISLKNKPSTANKEQKKKKKREEEKEKEKEEEKFGSFSVKLVLCFLEKWVTAE
jgi:hypothetical protein